MNYEDNVITLSTVAVGEDLYVKDCNNQEFHFKIATFQLPPFLIAEAIEIRNDDQPGYNFSSMFEMEEDPDFAKLELIKKIRKGINSRYIENSRFGPTIRDKIICGRIQSNNDLSDTDCNSVLVVEGKRITFEKLSKIMESVEGWQFKIEILDRYEECD